MLNNKGLTLIETLMAFSIFITVVVVILTCYNSAIKHYQQTNYEYQKYIDEQQIKEQGLWHTNGLSESLNEVLH